jgi:hypothetical protein
LLTPQQAAGNALAIAVQNGSCLNIAFDDIVLVIETFGFRICFGFGASDFEFAEPAIM